jgi:hypothetical protein
MILPLLGSIFSIQPVSNTKIFFEDIFWRYFLKKVLLLSIYWTQNIFCLLRTFWKSIYGNHIEEYETFVPDQGEPKDFNKWQVTDFSKSVFGTFLSISLVEFFNRFFNHALVYQRIGKISPTPYPLKGFPDLSFSSLVSCWLPVSASLESLCTILHFNGCLTSIITTLLWLSLPHSEEGNSSSFFASPELNVLEHDGFSYSWRSSTLILSLSFSSS